MHGTVNDDLTFPVRSNFKGFSIMQETCALPFRCPWCGDDPIYVAYHDHEWGRPQHDARALFEMLCLESFQAGLSWITILRKRIAFRAAFAGFDPQVLSTWGEADVLRLLADPGIVRHRGKIEATLRGARAFLRIESREGFSRFLWSFVGGVPQQNRPITMADVPTVTPAARALSAALKQEGFGFLGPTTTYAFMQAAGLVNDHLQGCHAASPDR